MFPVRFHDIIKCRARGVQT